MARLRALMVGATLGVGLLVTGSAPVAAAVPSGPWSSLNSGTSEALLSVSCPGSGTCYAVGTNGVIIVTRDGGSTWSGLASGTFNRLDSISCPAVLVCFVAGPFPPTLLVTKDGGATWADDSAAASQPLAAISCADMNTCVAVGLVGYAIRTFDGGATWSATNAPTSSFLLGVSCPTTSTCYAVGAAGVVIVKSTDGGASWSDVTPATDHFFLDIYCSSDTTCIAVGGRDRLDQGDAIIMTTGNGGATWTSRASNTTNQLAGVSCFGGVDCFAVGQSGTVLASDDGGATWTLQVHSSSNFLETASCLSATVCFVPGLNGTMLASPAGPRTVTNANDAGSGSLRAAIDYANNHPGLDTITFGIGTGPHSIALQSGLPAVLDAAVLDATTQPGYAGAPIIELNGGSAGGANGLTLLAGSTTIRGFVINRFFGFGVRIDSGGGDIVAANYIGTDMTGTAPGPNFSNGIVVFGPSTGNLIGGTTAADRNVISGNQDKAIVIVGGGGATIAGNFIGVDVTGTLALPNRFWGVALDPGNDSTITGNVISGNGLSGILIANGSHGNVVERNLIGTNAAGTASIGNIAEGVVVADSPNNTIGRGNVVSGNGLDGVVINGPQSTGNVVAGNLIGTDLSGTHALGNARIGVYVPFATHNTVGGLAPGDRNVIAGNPADGVNIGGDANVVQGNYIGTDITGTQALGNDTGVFIFQGANNLVGGTIPAARNVIAANRFAGINIGGGSATGNMVQGNYIGTDASGSHALGNAFGVTVFMGLNAIGGDQPGAGNVISGNQYEGVAINSCGGNVIQGNLIGTDRSGTVAIGNGDSGITLQDGFNNLIGGPTAGERNVVSGNAHPGIQLVGSGATGNRLQGNYVGTDRSGTVAIPNGFAGVLLQGASNNTVGPRNVISGNAYPGIELGGPDTTANLVQGNLIGTDASGSHALPNGGAGISVDGAGGNTIGGSTADARNVVSGNGLAGIGLNGAGPGNTIAGNYIGTDSSGAGALPNQAFGIVVNDSPSATIRANVIAANTDGGVYIAGGSSSHTLLQGNLIGTDASGTHALGNGGSGVTIQNASDTLIGGTAAGARNVISANSNDGINLFGDQSTRNVVQGNYIGTDASGVSALGNGFDGVQVQNGPANTVGGSAPGAGNVVSGNAGAGIDVDFGAVATVVQGNLAGTDRTGMVALGNGFGTNIFFAMGSIVQGNVISGNIHDGMILFGDQTSGNQIQGNFIGTDSSGQPLPNHGNGIIIDADASGNAFRGNVIAFNDFNGVVVWRGVRDSIRANSIYSNGAMGIDLNNDGVTLNDRGDRDGGANNSQNFPVLSRLVGTPANLVIEGSIDTPNPQTVTIEIYANASPNPGADFTGYGEGQTLIGTVKPNAAGRFSIVLPAVPTGTVISATATDAQGNTSEFALDRTA